MTNNNNKQKVTRKMARELRLRPPSTTGSTRGGGGGDKYNWDPVPDNTVFEARVISIVERDSKWDDDYNPGQKKREYNFRFEVDDPDHPDHQGRWFWGNTNTYFADTATNKLRQWIGAIEDLDVFPEGYVVDLDEIESRRPRVRIIIKAGERANGEGIWNGVKELRPSRLKDAPAPLTSASSTPDVEDPF
jgi:hypothetical protein